MFVRLLRGLCRKFIFIEYRDAFHLFDRDGNGKVSSEELGPLMRCLGSNPNGDHLQELINEVDYDGKKRS